ncbi:hypothetical protein KL866_06650 [Alteromonas sp. ALT199]|uniref:hypothetical protein n=1 Tax=unclassified Alteromonas TaxID=2614992 RepID=UPI001BE7E2B7|nr:hypothetical protein [Alteromonas sp. ALT199]MBT3134780.1 hypothetical protein [Alteromonas sp. ALT199]
MKFVTKFSVLVAILMLATGCVTQRGMEPRENVPSEINVDKSSSGDQTNNDVVDQEADVSRQKSEDDADEAKEPTEVPKQKIGVFINANEFPSHTHVGTTKFNNFTKEYAYDWQIASTLFTRLKTAIEQSSSFEVVDVSPKVKGAWQLDFVVKQDDKWLFNDNQNALRKSLLADGVTKIIVVQEAPTVAITECGTYGCSEHQSEGFGLFTRSFLGTDYYIASASFDISIESLDKPVDSASNPLFKELQDDAMKNVRIEEFIPPEDFDEVTEKELGPIKDSIISYFDRLAETAAKYFSNQ